MQPNKHHSYNSGRLPKGCQYCVRGEKLVIFVTGICPRSCQFCPVSDEKYQKDISFANERKLNSTDDLIKEAELMQAKGAGITGGDPLTKLDRTIEHIKLLKNHFGKEFHLHLYTSLNLATKETLESLHNAGLDEIRFHPDLNNQKLWPRIELAKQHDWDIGIEIPLLPTKEKEIKQLVDFIHDKVDFLNLNELEAADNEQFTLKKEIKDPLSYAIKGSLELGQRIMAYIKEHYKLPTHLCTAKLKDATQLSNRIKREAQRAKHYFDIVDEEGMLTRGALYIKGLVPGFSYREKLKTIDKQEYIQKLIPPFNTIQDKLKLEDKEIFLDLDKPRILLSKKNLKKNKKLFKKLKLIPAIVKEYPTADQLEVEVDFV